VTLEDLQPDALAAFDAARARAAELIDPGLLRAVRDRVTATLEGTAGPSRDYEPGAREIDCLALVDQMLIDVSSMSDETVAGANRHFAAGGLWDFVASAYLMEASIRLDIASARLLGGRP
jgi:hypothetical protein